MNDIRPAKRPPKPNVPQEIPAAHRLSAPPPELMLEDTASPDIKPSKKSPKKLIIGVITTVLLLIIVTIIGGIAWYTHQLQPVSADANASRVRLTIALGATPDAIADQLAEKRLIRSATAFRIYTKLSRTQNRLQAGTYSLSPTESTARIVEHLVTGKTDEFTLTFLPGATLAENRHVLLGAGYGVGEVDAALKKAYDHALFTDKPASADLEGYIYGETYNFSTSASVEDILVRTFDEYYQAITAAKLVEGFKAQGLNLYEGITLASIIQREVSSETDEAQVAQVFLKRLREGTVLGSDVTYKYAAKHFNLVDSPLQDSTYNTRLVKGLPPGPIATPGLGALKAVAQPAAGDYEFFLAGDDGITYFAHTEAEHEANIKDHCQIGCAE
ncbi:MAG: Endolytic murein transglycosylase [Candidatus Saccharibacteria bacterium]|nr:Endolytic murein transglycosylase [Candidatus Saccharibacteria bacterium]